MTYDIDSELKQLGPILHANQNRNALGNCSACAFRNYGALCARMLCITPDGTKSVWWTIDTRDKDAVFAALSRLPGPNTTLTDADTVAVRSFFIGKIYDAWNNKSR